MRTVIVLLAFCVLHTAHAWALQTESYSFEVADGDSGICDFLTVTVEGCGAQVFESATFNSQDDGTRYLLYSGVAGQSFAAFAQCLTNGVDDTLTINFYNGNTLVSQHQLLESDFIGNSIHPAAPDLSGDVIRSVGIRADAVSINQSVFVNGKIILYSYDFTFIGEFLINPVPSPLAGPLFLLR